MTSNKRNAALLADLFVKHGLEDIIISPGSRNAPVIISFAGKKGVKAISIVDERSAGFYALGMAQQKKKAVAVSCTSGTAALNYAPAIAEAYYQKIPLLIFTADRPADFIDIGDGQAIRQKNVYKNYIKASFEITEDTSKNLAEKIINKAIDLAHHPEPGPVHINLPFNEPLYDTVEKGEEGNVENFERTANALSESYLKTLAARWNNYERVMIIAGQQDKNPELNRILSGFVNDKRFVVLIETTSNFHDENFVGCIDNVLVSIKEAEEKIFKPDLLVTFGGHIVSKKIKKYLRDNKPVEHWHISPSGQQLDTFFSLTKTIKSGPLEFFKTIDDLLKPASFVFANTWIRRRNKIIERRDNYLSKVSYSDLKVFDLLFDHIPTETVLHLGNSTPVRYSQLFGVKEWFTYRSNRGVSGIDGQISTAAGTALADKSKLNVLITGDLGFFYDLNGLTYAPSNLKIILINNGGGGIFRFIPGPDSSPFLEKFFEAKHNRKAEDFVKAFGIKYFTASNITDIVYSLPEFFNETEKPAILEIFTPGEKNAKILRDYFKFLGK